MSMMAGELDAACAQREARGAKVSEIALAKRNGGEVDFQWKDTVAPLMHYFDTKGIVLQTSVGASPMERLAELKKMDARFVMLLLKIDASIEVL